MHPPQLALATFTIPSGDTGIDQTVHAMAALIREGARSPLVQQCAADICSGSVVDPADGYRAIHAIREWVGQRWTFVLDPDVPAAVFGMPDDRPEEILHSPEAQLREIAETGTMTGDCDDAAILAGALCAAVGCETKIICVGFGLDNVPAYVHTWCEARPFGGEAFLELDVTRTAQQLPDAAITRAAQWTVT